MTPARTMTLKPTPGPWKAEWDHDPEAGNYCVIIGADGSIVTYVDGDGNMIGDAPVLAAAWEMERALEKIAATEETVDPLHLPGNYAQTVCGIAREALTAARGQS